MKNNKNLATLIKLRLDYKIPILILLTHFDNYCDEIKKTENNWEEICANSLYTNTKDLSNYINNKIIKEKYNEELKFEDDDVLHIVLVEPKKMSDEDFIKTLSEEDKKIYDNSDETGKKNLLRFLKKGSEIKEEGVQKFLRQNSVLGPKELIKKLKEKFPHQYHNCFYDFK